jgi:hypothetical protein
MTPMCTHTLSTFVLLCLQRGNVPGLGILYWSSRSSSLDQHEIIIKAAPRRGVIIQPSDWPDCVVARLARPSSG